MTHYKTYTYKGYEFTLLLHSFDGNYFLIDQNAPIEDPNYREAFVFMQSLMPYFEAIGWVHDYGPMQVDQPYPDGYYSKYPYVLMTIEAYENGQIPVSEATYNLAITLRDSIRPVQQPKSPRAPKKRKGYVYLVKSVSGHYKIGRTVDPQSRAKTFGVKLPFEVEFQCLIETDDYEALELELHDRFEAQRVNGEWFNLSAEDVDYIKSLAGVVS